MANDDVTRMDDVALIAHRRYLREALLDTPDDGNLRKRYSEVTAEFDKRARAAWAQAG